jgi:hypothetical protein
LLIATASVILVPIAVGIVPNRLTRPYRYRVVDSSRGIARFQGKSEAYTELLRGQWL